MGKHSIDVVQMCKGYIAERTSAKMADCFYIVVALGYCVAERRLEKENFIFSNAALRKGRRLSYMATQPRSKRPRLSRRTSLVHAADDSLRSRSRPDWLLPFGWWRKANWEARRYEKFFFFFFPYFHVFFLPRFSCVVSILERRRSHFRYRQYSDG